MTPRTIVTTDDLWRLVSLAGRNPDPDLRAAAQALVRSGTTPAPAPRSHLSPQEAADLLGVHEKTVRTWIKTGELPARRLGRRLFIPTAALTETTGRKRTTADTDDASVSPDTDDTDMDTEAA